MKRERQGNVEGQIVASGCFSIFCSTAPFHTCHTQENARGRPGHETAHLPISEGLGRSSMVDFWKVPSDPQTHSEKNPSWVRGVGKGRKEGACNESLTLQHKRFGPSRRERGPATTLNARFTQGLEETHTHRGINEFRQVAKEICVNSKHRHISWPSPAWHLTFRARSSAAAMHQPSALILALTEQTGSAHWLQRSSFFKCFK